MIYNAICIDNFLMANGRDKTNIPWIALVTFQPASHADIYGEIIGGSRLDDNTLPLHDRLITKKLNLIF